MQKDKIEFVPENAAHLGTICVYPNLVRKEDILLRRMYDEIISIISKHENIYVLNMDCYLNKDKLVHSAYNIWIRDYGPLWAKINNKLVAVFFKYKKEKIFFNFTKEYFMLKRLMSILNIGKIKLRLRIEGGNFLYFDNLVYSCNNSLYDSSKNRNNFVKSMINIFSISNVVWMDCKENDVCGHIDNVCTTTQNDLLFFYDDEDYFKSNIYSFNGGVLLPKCYKNTHEYVDMIKKHFPNKEFYYIDTSPLERLHGGLHCILKEVPLIPGSNDE